MPEALEGIRILSLSRVGIAMFCEMVLGDFGAEIIKVESPEIPRGRTGPSVSPVGDGAQARAAFKAINRNKKSITLDLRSDQGRDIFYRLAEKADVIIEGFRPGVVKRLKVDYETISRFNPRVVYCSISGFGQDGPYRDLPGHDPNYISIGGALGLIGQREGPPVIPLNLVADYAGGSLHAAIGILIALRARDVTGRGQYVDISMTDAVVNLMFRFATDYFQTGIVPKRGELEGNGAYPCYGVYQAKDGRYISIGCLEAHFWENLCRALGREDLAAPQNAVATGGKGEEVRAILRNAFLTRTRDEWVEYLRPRDICVAPVYDLNEVFNDPQVIHRQMVVDVVGTDGTRAKQIGIAIKLSDTPGTIKRAAPTLGEHTLEILQGLGYSETEIRGLREKGVVL